MTDIIFIDKVCRNQAVSLASAKGMLSLIERGFSRYGHPWDLPAIAAMSDGLCVGVLLIKIDEAENSATVSLAWCDADRPDVLRRLLAQLRTMCREKQITEVFFTCHDQNDDMRKAAQAVGALPWSQTFKVTL